MPVLTLIDAKIVLEETKMMDKDSFICLCLSSVHRSWWLNNNFVPAFGAYVGFAGGADKAVAACAVELCYIPRFSTVSADNLSVSFVHSFFILLKDSIIESVSPTRIKPLG